MPRDQEAKKRYDADYAKRPEARDRRLERQKRYRIRLRREVLDGYGCRCNCCGETQPEFLALDHVNNDGHVDRRNGSKPSAYFYLQIIRANFPSRFQILCHNCNMAKGFYGSCPHRRVQEQRDGNLADDPDVCS